MFSSIIKMLLTMDEIDQIKAASEWTEETNEYKVPCFFFKDKSIKFPKLPYGQGNYYVYNRQLWT